MSSDSDALRSPESFVLSVFVKAYGYLCCVDVHSKARSVLLGLVNSKTVL